LNYLGFLAKYSEPPEALFLKATVSMFTESIAKRSFPSMEFGQMQIKGVTGELTEATNDLILEKSWLVYNNLCKIGSELTIAKKKVYLLITH